MGGSASKGAEELIANFLWSAHEAMVAQAVAGEPSARAEGLSGSEKRWGWGPSALIEDSMDLLGEHRGKDRDGDCRLR
jgi:hypothetical protein